jgi:hypothetical protein
MPLYWAGAALAALFLASKRSQAAAGLPDPSWNFGPDLEPSPDPNSPPTYGEPQVASPFPGGYRRLKQSEVTPELLAAARSIRSSSGFTSKPYGTVIPIDGQVSALVEQHFHEPGGPVKPWGYHHGVTLIRKSA